ncbi:MAG TPA: sodium:solute symporter family protein [Pseudonocardiaceae bacterium]|jgi:SSS family solute:Na+ symporter|nr:sodium:solute symporter family protein [Pseudonocardiaceae bacterium]
MRTALSVGIVAVFLAATVVLGLLAARGRSRRGLAEWSVGGRSMGVALTWVLMAGETYTSFSYLGAAGWSYTHGISALYVVAYLAVGMAVSYVVAPMLWTYARTHDLVNVSDMVAHRFRAPWLGAVVAVLATVCMLPYIQLQITGLGVVVTSVSYGAIGLGLAYLIAFVVSEAFVLASGLRGSAWVSVLKDSLVVLTFGIVLVYVPVHFFGGFGGLLHKLTAQKAAWLTLPGPHTGVYGLGWFISTAVLNGVVYPIFPTQVAGFLGARGPQVLRRNAIILPFYQVLLFVPVLLGMAALFVVPNLGDSDLALFAMIRDALPAPVLGLVGAAGALSSIVPMAVFMLTIGTLWSRSVLGLHPRTAPRQRQLAQLVTLLAGALALGMTYVFPNVLVRLSVVSYEGIAQLLPIVLIALLWRRMSIAGAVAGLAVGLALVSIMVFGGHDPWHGVNAGLIALAANIAVTVAVSALRPANAPDDRLASLTEEPDHIEETALPQ